MTLRNPPSIFFGQEDQMSLCPSIEIQAKTQWGGLDFPHLMYSSPVVFSQLYLDLCSGRVKSR